MNKKIIIFASFALLFVGSVAAIAYVKTRPETMTVCDSLLWKVLEAKTQAEYNYADARWRSQCVTTQP